MLSRRELVPDLIGRVVAGPAVIVLTALAGAGKSHTLLAVAAGAGLGADRILRATGSEATVLHPYAVAAALLDVDVTGVPGAERVLLDRLDEIAASGPLLLVIDDAHVVDAASLGLLEQAASAAGDLPVRLLLARRPDPERAQLTRLLQLPVTVEVELGPLDVIDLDVIVHERTGSWPDARLRAELAAVATSPLEAITALDDLLRDGSVGRPGASVQDRIALRVEGLDGPPRELARALAVLGGATELDDLAALMAVAPIGLVEPAQVLLDEGLVAFGSDEGLDFVHDAYRQAVYDSIPVALRRLLHRAVADQAPQVDLPRHLIGAEAPTEETAAAVRASSAALAGAPAVQADALGGAPGGVSAELAAVRARALARSGQLRRAGEVALAALDGATDPIVVTELMRVMIFSRSTRADLPGVFELIDLVLSGEVPERTRQVLTEHRTYMSLLGGLTAVEVGPTTVDPRSLTLNGLTAETLRCYLTGRTTEALEYAWDTVRRQGTEGVDPNEGASVDVWPPIIELQHNGPAAASAALLEIARMREEQQQDWLTVPHQFTAATIDFVSGRYADAAVQLDAALEVAGRTELGWVSQGYGMRAMVDVVRNDLASAEKRLSSWDAAPGTLQLGIREPERVRVALLEAQRRYPAAAALARAVWAGARRQNLHIWMVAIAPELARVALRAADAVLLAEVTDGLAELPDTFGPAMAPARALAAALTGPVDQLAAGAVAAAGLARGVANRTVELTALEEAAVATATHGDKDAARDLARSALELAEDCGAAGPAARIHGRLRAAGVRLGATAGRRRPQTGWDSLTPTEQLVAELVGSGLTGPQTAARLHISPRTVQTHVSHALAKLGLTNRVELAAVVATRTA
jgi:DNA-binding CsgD family transcriptional regulator